MASHYIVKFFIKISIQTWDLPCINAETVGIDFPGADGKVSGSDFEAIGSEVETMGSDFEAIGSDRETFGSVFPSDDRSLMTMGGNTPND